MKNSIYIFSDGALKRESNTVKFYCDEKRQFVPVEQVSSIYAFGEIDVTKKLLELLSQKEILLHYFNYYGYYMGTFYPREHYNSGFMILNQVHAYESYSDRIALAKSFVIGGIDNMLIVLNYYRNRGILVEEYIDRIEHLKEGIYEVNTVNSLMGIEGNVRETYYQSFDEILRDEDFLFEGRSKRPPLNYLNTLISFGNSLLYTTILGEVYQTHLDPRIGYLHSTNFRSFSLNLDLAEIFKPIIIDRIIFKLINKKMITKKDFKKHTRGILLTETGKKTFIKEYDEKLKSTIHVESLKRNASYRRLIRLELYKIQRLLMEGKDYIPFKAKW